MIPRDVSPPQHLLTMRLDRDIRSTEDCLARLKALEAQGRVWGQDLILHVKNQELVLSDVESKVPRGHSAPQKLAASQEQAPTPAPPSPGTHSGPSSP